MRLSSWSLSPRHRLAALALFIAALLPAVAHATPPADEQGTALSNVPALINQLTPVPETFTIPGTYSTHLFTTYSAGIHHVQGIAKLGEGRYVFSHDTRVSGGLLVIGDGQGAARFYVVGANSHIGAIQACGNIIVVPGDNLNTFFVDQNGQVLPPTINATSGAAGLAYHAQRGKHYVLLQGGVLWGSNGESLRSSRCTFVKLGVIQLGRGTIKTSQGGTQLLYDGDTQQLYAVSLDRSGGFETLDLYRIDLTTETSPKAELVSTKQLSRYCSTEDCFPGGVIAAEAAKLVFSFDGDKEWDYGPGFRWGGGIYAKSPTEIEVVAAARTLTNGPAAPYANAERWSSRNNVVTFFNDGLYVASYNLSYVSRGSFFNFPTGDMGKGNKKSYVLPDDAVAVIVSGKVTFPFHSIFGTVLPAGTSMCFKTTGFFFDPKVTNDCW